MHKPVAGTPQGGVISPMLSNVYLHHVLDEWFEEVAKPRLHGRCQLVRFADDFVIAFEDRHDHMRRRAELKRFDQVMVQVGIQTGLTKGVDHRAGRPGCDKPCFKAGLRRVVERAPLPGLKRDPRVRRSGGGC